MKAIQEVVNKGKTWECSMNTISMSTALLVSF